MKIKTRFFDEIDIDENQIIFFKQGIPGFENLKKFALLDIEDNPNLKCLQSFDESSVCLLIVSPWNYFENYQIQLSDNELEELKIENEQDVLIFNVISIRENKVTANLVAPIIINVINNFAKQIILSEGKYSIRQEIACL